MRIEERYVDSLPEAEQKDAQLEEMQAASGVDPTIPRILFELIGFPYLAGPPFTRALFDAGGQPRLDAAFREPPVTSEQILHPDRYLADGEPPKTIDNPKADAKVIDEGVMGQFGMLLILERLIGNEQAFEASDGWGGDRYVAWRKGDDTCVRTALVFDTVRDAREMKAALETASEKRAGLRITASGDAVTFTACG